MRNFQTNTVHEILRIKKEGARPPLRTLQELAEELGVSPATLSALILHRDGPKPVQGRRATKKAAVSWYDPREVRAWWKANCQ